MKKMKMIVLMMVALLCLPQLASAKDMKVGVIDFRKLVSESKDVKAARTKLEGQFKPKQAEIMALQKSVKEDMEKFQRDASVMTDTQKKELQQKVMKARQELSVKGNAYEQQLNQARNQTMQVFFEKVKKVVDEVAKEGHYDLILQRENTPYANSAMDITNQVAKKL